MDDHNWPRNYSHWPLFSLDEDLTPLRPLKWEDRLAIREWRNSQLDILRQKNQLSIADQDLYFEKVIAKEMDCKEPAQILVAMDQNSLVAYGGLTNISWTDKHAEMSFLVSELNNHGLPYEQLFRKFVPSLLSLAKVTFGIRRVYTETYIHRSQQIALLGSVGFEYEGTLKEHTYHSGSYIDSVLHGIILQ